MFISCIETHTHGRQVTPMFSQITSSYDIASQCIKGVLEAYFTIKNHGEQEKEY